MPSAHDGCHDAGAPASSVHRRAPGSAWGRRAPGLCVFTLAGVLAAGACAGGDAPEGDPVVVRDSAGVTVITSDLQRLPASCSLSAEPRLTIGDRPGDEAHELYRVFGATVLGDGGVALVNQGSQELRIYSPQGDLLSSSGRAGQGPGEFQDAFLLWRLPGDTLWVGDYRPWEFEVFAPDGTWVRMVRPEPRYPNPPRGFAIFDDGRTILAGENILERARDFGVQHLYLAAHDASGRLVDTVAVLPNGRWGQLGDDPSAMWLYPWFESFAEFTGRGDRLILAHGSAAELRVYHMAEEMRLESIVRWVGVDRSVSDGDVRAARQELVARYPDLDPAMRERLVDPLVHEDRPVADSMPALVDVAMGTDGSIWIRQYPRPGGPDHDAWVRFDDAGRFLCRLEAPPDLDIYEFGGDYVLGKSEGALGVEVVVLHALFPPG